MARQTGARALRAVLEEVMLEIMYELPDAGAEGVTYVIDREGIIRAVIRHDLRIGQHVPDVVAALDALPAA